MKLTVDQSTLKSALAAVSRAVATRSTLPVMSNVLLSADGAALEVAATNLEIGIRTQCEADVALPGRVTIPARLLAEFVAAAPAGAITLALNERTQTLTVTAGRAKANVKGMDASEFPEISSAAGLAAKGVKPVRLPVAAFRRLAAGTTFAAATEDSRPVLTCVLVELTDAGVTFATADGFRLAVATDAAWQTRDSRLLVPAPAIEEAAKLASGAEVVEMYTTETQVLFAAGGTELVAQLVAGNFPDYQQIIPKSWTTRAVVRTAELAGAVKMVRLFARDSADQVRLAVTYNGSDGTGVVVVVGTSAQAGDGAADVPALELTGNSVEIAFSARYLADALAAVNTPDVALELTSASSPGVVRPVGEGADAWLCVVMPMMLTR